MISMSEALSWLNQFGHSHLSKVTRFWINQMTNRRSSEDEVDQAIEKALGESKDDSDRLHYAEVLLNCAETEFMRKKYDQAKTYIDRAEEFYPEKTHRKAVALWMTGLVGWEVLKNILALKAWYQARNIFRALAQENVQKHEPVRATWYNDQLRKMNVELTGKIEPVFGWMTEFEQIVLDDVTKGIEQKLLENFQKNQYPSAYQLVSDLKVLCKNCSEYLVAPYILSECAMISHQMGNPNLAIDLLNQGVALCHPRSHHQAVERWMLGIVQWQLPAERRAALRNWEEALEGFDLLALSADYHNFQVPRKWYQEMRELMQEAIKDKIAYYFT